MFCMRTSSRISQRFRSLQQVASGGVLDSNQMDRYSSSKTDDEDEDEYDEDENDGDDGEYA